MIEYLPYKLRDYTNYVLHNMADMGVGAIINMIQ